MHYEQGTPPNTWCQDTDAFGNLINICMQSPTDGLSFGACNFRIQDTYNFIEITNLAYLGSLSECLFFFVSIFFRNLLMDPPAVQAAR